MEVKAKLLEFIKVEKQNLGNKLAEFGLILARTNTKGKFRNWEFDKIYHFFIKAEQN